MKSFNLDKFQNIVLFFTYLGPMEELETHYSTLLNIGHDYGASLGIKGRCTQDYGDGIRVYSPLFFLIKEGSFNNLEDKTKSLQLHVERFLSDERLLELYNKSIYYFLNLELS